MQCWEHLRTSRQRMMYILLLQPVTDWCEKCDVHYFLNPLPYNDNFGAHEEKVF